MLFVNCWKKHRNKQLERSVGKLTTTRRVNRVSVYRHEQSSAVGLRTGVFESKLQGEPCVVTRCTAQFAGNAAGSAMHNMSHLKSFHFPVTT